MTNDAKVLVERLRWSDGWVFKDPYELRDFASDAPLDAADRIEALSAENERLREALEKIVKMYPDDGCLQWACAITARAALGEQQ